MKHSATIFLALFILQTNAAPQFITFKDGKLGVNFMGYHAGVGFGGVAGSNTAGGLYAEAGTPTGQSARAGLGGKVDEQGRASGGLFAGATAGGNVGASAGLAGGVNENKAEGGGFATAQAGKHIATSGLGGQSSIAGSSGFSFSKNNNVALPIYKEVHTPHKIDAISVIEPETTVNLNANANAGIEKSIVTVQEQPTVIVKEVYIPKHKHHRRIKPHHKINYVSYVGESEVAAEPKIERRIDVGAEGAAKVDFSSGANAGDNFNQVYTKQISVQRNPEFFKDIFQIPISTLKAVGNFLSNTAANTNISVQKTASINADVNAKSINDNHSPSLLKSSQSSAHVSVETPSASKFIDNIFAIPINTLEAVNTFLENNVPARKTIRTVDGSGETIQLRGPARRRANKRVIITNQPDNDKNDNTDTVQ